MGSEPNFWALRRMGLTIDFRHFCSSVSRTQIGKKQICIYTYRIRKASCLRRITCNHEEDRGSPCDSGRSNIRINICQRELSQTNLNKLEAARVRKSSRVATSDNSRARRQLCARLRGESVCRSGSVRRNMLCSCWVSIHNRELHRPECDYTS